TYDYYADGLLQSLTRTVILPNDAIFTLTDRYEYDINGRVTRETLNNGNFYDSHYDYDALGRLTGIATDGPMLINYPDEVGYYLNLTYRYDAVGNIRHVSGARDQSYSETEYIYGQYGQVVDEIYTPAKKGIDTIDMWYLYDGEDRVIRAGVLA